jgi:hypothetical protein
MVAIMTPGMVAYRGASEKAADTLVTGVALQIDNLAPGVTTQFQFEASPGMNAVVVFFGSAVTATVNGFVSSRAVNWPLNSTSLYPGVQYVMTLRGGVVTVA